MKKLSILCSAAALLGAASLGWSDHHQGVRGFIGADGGWAFGRGVIEKTRDDVLGTSNIGLVGGDVGVFLGAMYAFDNHFCLGIEGTAGWMGAGGRIQGSVQPLSMNYLRQKNAFGVNALLGFACPLVHPYLRAGWSNAKFEGKYSALDNEGWGARSVSKSGFLLGLGADFCVADGVFVGGAFDHAWYGSFTYETDGTNTVKLKVSPQTDKFTVRLKFVF